MAVKSTGTEPTSTPKASTTAKSDDRPTADASADPRPKVDSDCVVDADFHVGRAVNGKVCSYHAMHYDREGNRRK